MKVPSVRIGDTNRVGTHGTFIIGGRLELYADQGRFGFEINAKARPDLVAHHPR